MPAPALDRYEMAMLEGGPRMAAITALLDLWERDLLDLGDGVLRELAAAGEVDLETVTPQEFPARRICLYVRQLAAPTADLHPVAAAVYHAAGEASPPVAERVVSAAVGAPAMVALSASLVERGLLRSSSRRRWAGPRTRRGARALAAAGPRHCIETDDPAVGLALPSLAPPRPRRPRGARRANRPGTGGGWGAGGAWGGCGGGGGGGSCCGGGGGCGGGGC